MEWEIKKNEKLSNVKKEVKVLLQKNILIFSLKASWSKVMRISKAFFF